MSSFFWFQSNRKTLHGNDVVHAMKDMEFEKFVKPLEQAWDSWKSCQAKKKEETAKRKKDKAEAEAKKQVEQTCQKAQCVLLKEPIKLLLPTQADSKSDSTKSDGASSPKKAKPATEDKENKEDDEVEEVPQE